MNLFLSQAVLTSQAAGLDLYVVAAGGVRERMDEEAVDNARRHRDTGSNNHVLVVADGIMKQRAATRIGLRRRVGDTLVS